MFRSNDTEYEIPWISFDSQHFYDYLTTKLNKEFVSVVVQNKKESEKHFIISEKF